MLLLGCLCSTWRCPQEPPRHRHLHGVPISTGCQAELLLQHQQHPSQPLNGCWGPRSDPHRHRRAGTRDAQGNAAPARDQTGARGPSCASSSGRTAASAAGSGHPGDTEAARWDAPARLNHPEKALCQQQAVLPVPHGGTGGTKGSSGAFGGRIGRSEGGTAACPRLRNPPEAGWSPSPHLPRQEAPLSPPKLIHRYLRISSRVTGPQPPERWHRGSRSKTTNSQGTFFFSAQTRTWTSQLQQAPQGGWESVGDFGLHQSPSPGAARREQEPRSRALPLQPPLGAQDL